MFRFACIVVGGLPSRGGLGGRESLVGRFWLLPEGSVLVAFVRVDGSWNSGRSSLLLRSALAASAVLAKRSGCFAGGTEKWFFVAVPGCA